VNYSPFECICKIRSGFVQAESWIPQRGNGNAAFLEKEALNALCFLEGDYLRNLPLNFIDGVGEKTYSKLKKNSYERLEDIKTIEDFKKVVSIVRKADFEERLKQYIEKAYIHIEDYYKLAA